MNRQFSISRRKFISGISAATAGIIILPSYGMAPRKFKPGEIVNIGIIGNGGQSMFSINELLKLDDVRIIAIADPAWQWEKESFYKSLTGRGPTKKYIEDFYSGKGLKVKVSDYEDFRLMLDKEKSLDAVVCATPDNTHAYVSITSMRAGKHVYCEKPLAHNIWEVRKMAAVAKETGLATQMGNQGHAKDTLRQTIEYLRSDVIGQVKDVHSWVSATRWIPELNGMPQDNSPVPERLNWDLWLGPTKFYPYNKAYTPVTWRDFWAFGCGALGDFGCHDMDTAFWAFGLGKPESVQIYYVGNRYATKTSPNEISPYGEIGYYNFAETNAHHPLKINWYSGGLRPDHPAVLPQNISLASRGALYIGEKGVILTNGGSTAAPEIFPLSLRESFVPPSPSLPRSKGHHREWIDAIKGGTPALSNFDYASNLTESVLLGVLSLRTGGKKILWDADNMKAKGLPEADEIIKEPVRKGWEM